MITICFDNTLKFFGKIYYFYVKCDNDQMDVINFGFNIIIYSEDNFYYTNVSNLQRILMYFRTILT